MFPGKRLHGIWVGERFFGVSGRVFWPDFSLFWFLSLELDLLTSTGFSKKRASPRWPSVSSDPAASNRSRAGSSRSAHSLHVPGRSLPKPTRVGHGLSSRARMVVLRWFRGLPVDFYCRGDHRWRRVFYMCRRRQQRFPMLVPFFASVLGCFCCLFLSFRSLPL
jgi:hypothetical protein